MAFSSAFQRKRALVIGIDNYQRNPLKYCINDAEDLSTTLECIGFNVTSVVDCNHNDFVQIIDTFVRQTEHNDLVLFYFAGHGKQHQENNYFLPSDYNCDLRKDDTDYILQHAIDVQYIMKKINDQQCRITIFLSDCCRNYVETEAINMQQGLSSMNAPAETLIVFSCAPGKATPDETQNGRNGIFIENLLKHIATPNHDIEDVFKMAACDVKNRTGGFQLLYRTSSLTENVCLVITNANGIPPNARWASQGVTIAGGHGKGVALNQLRSPLCVYVDDNQTVYIADYGNRRIMEWKRGATSGRVVAGGNGEENRTDQLNEPTDVIVDKEANSLIICDRGNRRVMRWSRRSGTTSGEMLIGNTTCSRLTMDDKGFLYVSDTRKEEVRRYRMGDTEGIVVAGGNGKGDCLNQLNFPTYVFVDREYSVYVSDCWNHRVMKWVKGATQGIVVAGGRGQGNDLQQLLCPQGVYVDSLGTVYVADNGNHRVMRWCHGATQGNVVVGGNGDGQQAHQLNSPTGLSFDSNCNLYVADNENHRVQRFPIGTS